MKAIKITEAEMAILSLVAEKPVYGYEIDQIIQQRGMREWTAIGFSSIYYLLKKIKDKGWITGRTSESTRQGIQRTIYTVTEAGLQVCRQATLQTISIPHSMPNSFLTALSNLPILSRQQIQEALSNHKQALLKKRDELELKRENQSPNLPMHVNLIFDYSIHAIQSEMDWVENVIIQLSDPPNPSAQIKRKRPNNQ
jgi:DNA-binding PadR family transcriptional regulator